MPAVSECAVSSNNTFVIEDNSVNLDLANSGEDPATISRISLTWPEGFGDLIGIILQGRVFKGTLPPPTAVLEENQLGDEKFRQIKANKSRTLKFLFENDYPNAQPTDLVAIVEFEEGCSVIAKLASKSSRLAYLVQG